jgi:carbon-monoxide dehydrogenase medium subunit
LEPDEILTEGEVPSLPPRSQAAYLKFGFLERPSVGVAVTLTVSKDKKAVEDVRIAVGCVGPVPKRMREAEALLKGKSVDEAFSRVDEAGNRAAQFAEAISDLHGGADYKEHLVKVLIAQAMRLASQSLNGRA